MLIIGSIQALNTFSVGRECEPMLFLEKEVFPKVIEEFMLILEKEDWSSNCKSFLMGIADFEFQFGSWEKTEVTNRSGSMFVK